MIWDASSTSICRYASKAHWMKGFCEAAIVGAQESQRPEIPIFFIQVNLSEGDVKPVLMYFFHGRT